MAGPETAEYTMNEVAQFVENNRIDAVDGRQCVDGRYEPGTKSSGMIARPGGDFGYVMALLALKKDLNLPFSPEDAFDKVYEAITENEGTFYQHTDQHAIKQYGTHPSRTGCGHIARAEDVANQDAYGAYSVDVQRALTYSRDKIRHPKEIEVNLPGDHEEKGVLVILGEDSTVEHSDGKNMYFVYDKDRDEKFMKVLVEKLRIEGVTYENFKAAADKQLGATLKLLAKGKPMYEVEMTSPPKVTAIGIVEG